MTTQELRQLEDLLNRYEAEKRLLWNGTFTQILTIECIPTITRMVNKDINEGDIQLFTLKKPVRSTAHKPKA